MHKIPRPAGISSRCPRLQWRPAEVQALFRRLDEEKTGGGIPAGELSVVFLGKKEMIRLNREFLGKNRLTDVIAFPGDPREDFAGEICVCPEAAEEKAAGLPFGLELTLYLVHGWLHLAGWDDRHPKPRRRMREAEAKILALLEKNGEVPAFKLK